MTFVGNEGVGGWPQLHPQLSPSPASLTHLVFTDIFDRGAKNEEDSRARRMIRVQSFFIILFLSVCKSKLSKRRGKILWLG